jgi:tetratricopeptide (TPR) repeat protein
LAPRAPAPPAVRVIPGATAETARIEVNGQGKFVVEWEAEAALEMSRGNPRRALEIYDLILQAFPQYAKAWYNKAVILHMTVRDFDRALDAYDRAAAALPGNLDILHNKAKLLSEMRRESDAAATYEQVLRVDPTYVKSLEGYAALLINGGSPDRAEPLLVKAEALYAKAGHDPYRALQLLATAYTNMGRSKEAVKTIDKALTKHPQDDTLWEAKGIALSNMEKYREAVQCLTQALRLNRGNRFAQDTRTQLIEVCKEHKIRFSEAELAF